MPIIILSDMCSVLSYGIVWNLVSVLSGTLIANFIFSLSSSPSNVAPMVLKANIFDMTSGSDVPDSGYNISLRLDRKYHIQSAHF